MDVAQKDKFSDMMKRIPSGGGMYVTSEGRVLRRSDELRSCGVHDWEHRQCRSGAGCAEEEDTRTGP